MASIAYAPRGTNQHNVTRDLSNDRSTRSSVTEPTIVLATVDPDIRASLSVLLKSYNVKAVSVTGLEELRFALAKEAVSACFCGFWLVDGTYRDVVRQLRRQTPEMPVIVVCAPGCSQEYRDYLAALNMRAFDYICHPYRKADLERILHSVVSVQHPGIGSGGAYSASLGADSGRVRAM